MYLIPPDITVPYGQDRSFWNGYEILESLVADGRLAHQLQVQNRLNELQAIGSTVQILRLETQIYLQDGPPKENVYFTQLWFSVLGSETNFPIL